MENKIYTLFKNNSKGKVSIYFTAGYPELNDTMPLLMQLQDAGADMVEIGIPYSDPLADGPVIQQTAQKAIENGMNLKLLLQQIKANKEKIHIPILLMGYLNPVMQFGMEEFLKECSESGISGLIIPDLPLNVYLNEYELLFKHYAIFNINLITPRTSDERIRYIDEHSNGFVYVVSSSSITGNNLSLQEDTKNYFKRIQGMNLRNPLMIGFGIHDKASCQMAMQYCSGAIIGTAFLKMITESKDKEKDIKYFVNQFK